MGLFEKDILVRLLDDGTGFKYTVKYGGLSLPKRLIRIESGKHKSQESSCCEAPDWPTDLRSGDRFNKPE